MQMFRHVVYLFVIKNLLLMNYRVNIHITFFISIVALEDRWFDSRSELIFTQTLI